jgi:hypothetical protein
VTTPTGRQGERESTRSVMTTQYVASVRVSNMEHVAFFVLALNFGLHASSTVGALLGGMTTPSDPEVTA